MSQFEPDSIHVSDVRVAVNCEPRRGGIRPTVLLMHYTGFRTVEDTLYWLAVAESRVSCHYVVALDGRITQMVPESLRAWHAGEGSWKGDKDINSSSIGIEIQNPGHERGYPDFPSAQMDAIIALAKDIVARQHIRPERVLAHSDVAPHRKIDPGEKFDWALLNANGIGHWVEPTPADPIDAPATEFAADHIRRVQEMLAAYGYGIEPTGELDRRTMLVVKAFQRHFRPARVDGNIDHSTADTLSRLIAALESAPVS